MSSSAKPSTRSSDRVCTQPAVQDQARAVPWQKGAHVWPDWVQEVMWSVDASEIRSYVLRRNGASDALRSVVEVRPDVPSGC